MITLDLNKVISFDINDDIYSLYRKSPLQIFNLLSIKNDEFNLFIRRNASNRNSRQELDLLNGTLTTYYINEQLFGMEIVNWNLRRNYIKLSEDFNTKYVGEMVMKLSISELLQIHKELNINTQLIESNEDPNYLKIICQNNINFAGEIVDIIIICDKKEDRIDYLIININSVIKENFQRT